MQVEGRDLRDALKADIPPVVLICGDETLLVEEACDQVLTSARTAGFDERDVRFAESGFVWESLLEEAQSMSLFGGRKIIDLRMQALRMEGQSTAQILKMLVSSPNPDTRVLIRTPELRKEQRNAAWFKAIDQGGLVVTIRAIEAGAFPGWLTDRLRKAGLRLDRDALEFFADMMEGNSLAAVQEIERLKLSGLVSPISREALAELLEDSSHHSGFAYVDAVFAGEATRVVRVLAGLAQEGQSLFGPLYLLTSALRRADKGDWMPPRQQRALPGFRKRAGSISRVLAQCALIDQQGKGQLLGDAWESLTSLSVNLCGKTLPDIAELRPWLIRH